MDMIERVAEALIERNERLSWTEARDLSRAAIEAMREPTDAQRNAYYQLSFGTEIMNDAHWQRAIDAILIGKKV